MSKYSISKVEVLDAKNVWLDSPQATVFTNPDVLVELAEEVHWWGVFKNEELRCVWPIALDKQARPIRAPFTYWQGPFWAKDVFNQPYHRSITLTSSVYELFIGCFIEKYGSIRASLHPSLNDVRIFDWWNYHQPNKPRFSIKPRYSAAIPIFETNIEEIKNNFRRDRRRDLNLSKKARENVFFNSDCTQEELIALYTKTLEINKSEVEKSIASLLKIVKKGNGWIQSVREKRDSSLCGLMVVLYDNQQANLVINIANPTFKSNRLMATTILRAIETAQQKGLTHFDFNGANSPFRGDDKHSYGAKPVLYFDVEYNVD